MNKKFKCKTHGKDVEVSTMLFPTRDGEKELTMCNACLFEVLADAGVDAEGMEEEV